MPRTRAGFFCPTCLENKTANEVYSEAGPGGARMICSTGLHIWTDMFAFRKLKLTPSKPVAKPVVIQTNHSSLTLQVPESIKAALESRYGDKLSSSLASILSACTETEMMIL